MPVFPDNNGELNSSFGDSGIGDSVSTTSSANPNNMQLVLYVSSESSSPSSENKAKGTVNFK
jgi:hypothetical protein